MFLISLASVQFREPKSFAQSFGFCKAQPSPSSGAGSRGATGAAVEPTGAGVGAPQGPARPPGGLGTGWDWDGDGDVSGQGLTPASLRCAGGRCPESRCVWCGQHRPGLHSLLWLQNHFLLLLWLVERWKNPIRIHLQNINSDEATVTSRKIFYPKLLPTFVHNPALLGPAGQTHSELAREEAPVA